MKIIDGLKLKGFPAEIPGSCRGDIPRFCLDMGYKVGAEVGVYEAEFLELFLKAGLQMHAVDPWGIYGKKHKKDAVATRKHNDVYEKAMKVMSKYDNCNVIRDISMNAVDRFENDSLDFVYIDANHKFRFIAEDIAEWSYKVKSGGALCGHDYYCGLAKPNSIITHVQTIVDAYATVYEIENFFLLGVKDNSIDKYLSWLWIKP